MSQQPNLITHCLPCLDDSDRCHLPTMHTNSATSCTNSDRYKIFTINGEFIRCSFRFVSAPLSHHLPPPIFLSKKKKKTITHPARHPSSAIPRYRTSPLPPALSDRDGAYCLDDDPVPSVPYSHGPHRRCVARPCARIYLATGESQRGFLVAWSPTTPASRPCEW